MSLLTTNQDPRISEIAKKIYDGQFSRDPKLEDMYDDRQKRLWYQDILYNISYLNTAVQLKEKVLFTRYAVWLYELLCSLMKQFDRDIIKDQMVEHYRFIIKEAPGLFGEEDAPIAIEYLQAAIDVTEEAVTNIPFSDRFLTGKYVEIRQAYLHALLRSKTREASQIIADAARSGIPLEDIYEDILEETMHEVGELWHTNQITVDKEHYCTSTTQMVLSQFYDVIFSKDRCDKVILTCCVGSELHEMGGRMVSDIFEYHGWDSIYLGAAVPEPSIISAVQEHHPDLVALSVTMPHYLVDCRNIVHALREQFPQLKIAVGGRAFEMTDNLWQRWPIDVYTRSARELMNWAKDISPISTSVSQ
jgi:methanogenic corrinoid protein MtbC1